MFLWCCRNSLLSFFVIFRHLGFTCACGNVLAQFLVWKKGKLFGAAPLTPAAFLVAFSLHGTSVSGAVFGVYVEDPELPLNYGGGPDEMLN